MGIDATLTTLNTLKTAGTIQDYAIAGGYVWLPMTFEKSNFSITWRDAWDLSVFDGNEPTVKQVSQTAGSASLEHNNTSKPIAAQPEATLFPVKSALTD